MKEEDVKKIFTSFKTVAVVGISPKEDRPSYTVASYLKSKGYRIIPVRPDGDEILGEKVYHSLSEIPKEIRSHFPNFQFSRKYLFAPTIAPIRDSLH